MKINNRYLIKTLSGYRQFDGVKETTASGLILETDKNIIKCTKSHRILKDGKFTQCKDLVIGDVIGDQEILSISGDSTQLYYDPVNVMGDNTYIAQGLVHHNCALIIVDETAFIKPTLWEEFSDSIFPAQSGLAWKKNILISTANGLNHFYDIVKGARTGSNGYIPFEVSWRDVPRYNPDGEIMSNDEFQSKIVASKGVVHFNQNYGNEFLGSSHTLISSEKLSAMESKEVEYIRDGKLNIYTPAQKDHKYIMSVDPAKDGTDAFAVQIVDITNFTFDQVATAQLQIDYLLMPEFLDEWGKEYNNAYLIIENNEGAGQSVADQMYQTYEYENLHFDKAVGRNKRKKYPGFRTTSKTRKQILQTLKLFIENGNLGINDNATIKELYQFILIKNKFQADDGAHDDMIMSLALIFVPFCNLKNFEDMKKLVQNLYDDDLPESEKVDFGDLLAIGSFDSMTDEDYNEITNINTSNYTTNSDGFI